MSVAAKIYSTAIIHLHDEQPDIRLPTCSFASDFSDDNFGGLTAHSNVAVQVRF